MVASVHSSEALASAEAAGHGGHSRHNRRCRRHHHLRGGERADRGGERRVQRHEIRAGYGVKIQTKAIRRFVITEKAPTRAFSWLKAAITAFTFKTLLRHYAKRAFTPRSLNVKLGPRRNYHKGRAAIGHYANQPLVS